MKTAIFIPTLHRPDKLQRVVDNIRANTLDSEIYFIVEPDDEASKAKAIELTGHVIINKEQPCYAGAINTAYHETAEPYFFTGADDMDFHPGWLEEAFKCFDENIKVVGTNDLGQIPIGEQRDSTHYLISRDYIINQSGVIDKPDTVLYPYIHNYTDKEFIETAKARKVFKYCPESVVEHLHPVWGKGQWDPVYQKGRETSNQDQQLYNERRPLWQTI